MKHNALMTDERHCHDVKEQKDDMSALIFKLITSQQNRE